MATLTPDTPERMAEALAAAAEARDAIRLGGAFTKDAMAGPIAPSGACISTTALNRVLIYEPKDLTISVEAGIRYRDLEAILAENGQMLPLDPPFSGDATIGGILATNSSGPRRLLYGTARDMVIGMKLATLDGKLVQSGGMVVKNVAGLDMAKLLIGSFGTLAAIAVANFKLVPKPPLSQTFVRTFESAGEAFDARDVTLGSVLQPAAMDLLNPAAARRIGLDGYSLVLQAGGSSAVMERYARELAGAVLFDGDEERTLWGKIQDFTPAFLAPAPSAAVIRTSCTLTELRSVVESTPGPAVARAASGVCYGYFESADAASSWMRDARERGWRPVIEFAPAGEKERLDLWPSSGADFEVMKRIKGMFDPGNLLNRGRLYGRL